MLLSSCSDRFQDFSGGDIVLSPSVGGMGVGTRAGNGNAYLGDVPSPEAPLAVDLWFTLDKGVYNVSAPTDNTTYLPCHTTHTFTSGIPEPIHYTPAETGQEKNAVLKYPTTGAPVYCMGFYPLGSWSFSNDSATASIDGTSDLMYAPEIAGSWNDQFGSREENTQTFRHALTWLKFVVCATSYDAVDAWGSVSKITVSTKDQVSLGLATGAATYGGNDRVLTVFEVADPQKLSTLHKEVGSVFCAPASSYDVTVTTGEGKTAEVTMKLPALSSGESYAGKQYVMVLYFNPLSVIDGLCTLSSWENENDNLYME